MFLKLKNIKIIKSFREKSNYYKHPAFLLKTLNKYGNEKGFWKTMTIMFLETHDLLFDIINRTNTFFPAHLEDLDIHSGNLEHGNSYTSTNVYTFIKILKKFVDYPEKKGYIDFGSGKGLTLLLAASHNFKTITGVEFSKDLCQTSIKNSLIYKNGLFSSKINTLYMDASKYEINHVDSVFYFDNPFNDLIMKKVLANILSSIKINNRRITIIYYSPQYQLDKLCNYLLRKDDCIILGKRYIIYENIEYN